MEALLATSEWGPIRSNDGTALATRQHNLYKQIVHTEAWKDYQHRLAQLREATRFAIERGGLDQHGRRHDDEQRAVLFMLDQMLGYWPAIQEQQAAIEAHLAQQEALANVPIYGDDKLNYLTSID